MNILPLCPHMMCGRGRRCNSNDGGDDDEDWHEEQDVYQGGRVGERWREGNRTITREMSDRHHSDDWSAVCNNDHRRLLVATPASSRRLISPTCSQSERVRGKEGERG